MTKPQITTAGDLAKFLEANPGPQLVEGYIAEYVGIFPPDHTGQWVVDSGNGV